MSARSVGATLWRIGWPGCTCRPLFAGTLDQVVAHLDACHRETGLQHTATDARTLDAGTLVEIAPEYEPPFVTDWDSFRRDNADDDSIDWMRMANVVAGGGTWRDGGGAAPGWSVRLAP
jgi:hypothetical protein